MLFFISDAETSLAEAAVLAQHEQLEEVAVVKQDDEKHDVEKHRRRSSSAASQASSTSSKASSTKGYPVKDDVDEIDDDKGRK